MQVAASELVTIHTIERCAILTLHHPKSLNSLVPGMLTDLLAKLMKASNDIETDALILTGAGKGFCSGANLSGNHLRDKAGEIEQSIKDELNPVILAIRNCPKPTFAAINGAAAGAGVGLAMACDFCVVEESAKLILSFAKIGAVLDAGTSHFIQEALGSKRALHLAITGTPVTGSEAVEWGLAQFRAVDGESTLTAISIAKAISRNSPASVRTIKWMLRQTQNLNLEDALDLEAKCQGLAFQTQNFREGIDGFQRGKQPNFSASEANAIISQLTDCETK